MKIRKLGRKDLISIVTLEEENSRYPLTIEEVNAYRNSVTILGYVAEEGEEVVGYSITSIKNKEYVVHKLVVAPKYRRNGLATCFVNKLKSISNGGRDIVYNVEESNLAGQLFLKSTGFRATKVLKEHFGTEDAYTMKWTKI